MGGFQVKHPPSGASCQIFITRKKYGNEATEFCVICESVQSSGTTHTFYHDYFIKLPVSNAR